MAEYTRGQRAIARRVIRQATRHAVYQTTKDGHPREPYATAFEEAEEAQLRAYEEADLLDHITTGGTGAEPLVTSTSNKGASLTFDHGRAEEATTYFLNGGLAPEAEAILDEVGLLGGQPWVRR